jgi:hypothetical protein
MAKFGAKADASTGRTDTDIGTIYWDKIQKLMEMDEEFNRLDRGNRFGGWEYDPETKSQNYVARSPGMQNAEDRMDRRLSGEGFDDYERPSQVTAITDALMADRMEKMGLIDPGVANLKQDSYGERFGDINNRTTIPQPQAAPQPPNANPMPPGNASPQPPGASNPNGLTQEQVAMMMAQQGGR